MGTRREARERALSLCYEHDVRGESVASMLDELPVPPDEYAEEILRGVATDHEDLDRRIEAAAEHWRVERMAVVDRVLLRIGCWELLHAPDVPTAVVISEAVELAKRYSTDESGRFVNGVLSALARDIRNHAPHDHGGDAVAG